LKIPRTKKKCALYHLQNGFWLNYFELSSLFTQNHLRSWIYCSSGHAPSGFRDSIFAVGVEILFNVDTLRQVYDEDHQLFVTLRNIPDDLVHPILPRIFTSFLHCLRKYRSALFGQGASQNPTDHVRETGFTFFDSCQVLLNQGSSTVLAWSARLGLLEVVREENMFGGNQLGGHNSLQKIIPLALSVLGSDCNGKNFTCIIKSSQNALRGQRRTSLVGHWMPFKVDGNRSRPCLASCASYSPRIASGV
jgi:hypothetical protein